MAFDKDSVCGGIVKNIEIVIVFFMFVLVSCFVFTAHCYQQKCVTKNQDSSSVNINNIDEETVSNSNENTCENCEYTTD